jgi:hypothetical protein
MVVILLACLILYRIFTGTDGCEEFTDSPNHPHEKPFPRSSRDIGAHPAAAEHPERAHGCFNTHGDWHLGSPSEPPAWELMSSPPTSSSTN